MFQRVGARLASGTWDLIFNSYDKATLSKKIVSCGPGGKKNWQSEVRIFFFFLISIFF